MKKQPKISPDNVAPVERGSVNMEPFVNPASASVERAGEYASFLEERAAEIKKEREQEYKKMLQNKAGITADTVPHDSMFTGKDQTPAARIGQRTGNRQVRMVSTRRAENWWIEESRTNIAAYMRYVWGLQPANHHIKWFKQMLDPAKEKTIIIGPRGSAKSTVALVFISWYMGHFPHLANVLISVTLKQAQDRLETVRDLIEHNDRYKKVFPHIAIDRKRPNNKTTLNIKRIDMPYSTWRSTITRYSDPKSPSMFASGVGGSQVIGSRCTGILLLDDLMDERNIATEVLREKLWTWVSMTLMPILTGKARVIHITTRWHTDDLVVRQINTGEWSYSYTRAMEKVGNKVKSYWPEEFPLKRLLNIYKAIGGPIFKIMYLCIPTALTGELFDIDMLRQPIPDPLPELAYLFVSVDAALKAKHQADDTAISVIGVPRTRDAMYVLEVHTGKWKPETTASKISSVWANAWEKYNIKPITLMETIGGMELFGVLLKNIGVVDMRTFYTTTPNVDKYTRALPLAGLAEVGGLYFNTSSRDYNKTVSQLLEFTGADGNADDIVDTLSQVARRIRGSIKFMVRQANTKTVRIPGAS